MGVYRQENFLQKLKRIIWHNFQTLRWLSQQQHLHYNHMKLFFSFIKQKRKRKKKSDDAKSGL